MDRTEAFNLESIAPMMGLDIYFLWPTIRKDIQKSEGIYLLPLDVPDGQPLGRLIDREVTDLCLVKDWIHRCDDWHVDTCRSARYQKLDVVKFLRVVDVHKKCLAYISSYSRYFALSYVWGKAKTLQTTRQNLKQLEQDGALSSQEAPRTIRDAIAVVSRIGERYIWIDALCIIQDKDSGEKPVLLRQMDKIYGNAYVTIVAAVGDNANVGLPGISSENPRSVPQRVLSYGNGRRLAISQSPFENRLGQHLEKEKNTCVWNQRAWTFQERLLSRRHLIFLEEGVHFNCRSMTWTEDVAAEKGETNRHYQMFDFEGVTDEDRWFSGISRKGSQPRKKDEYTLRGPDATFPSFVDYCSLVSNHLQRDLSYEEDVINSFSGILSSLSHAFGSFYYGLPEVFFTLALLWQPRYLCRRRLNTTTKQVAMELPSWSWAGWTCEVDLEHWHAACDYAFHEGMAQTYRTTPATTFSVTADPTAQAPGVEASRFQISDDGLRYRSLADEPPSSWTTHLPDGWDHEDVKERIYLGRRRFTEFRLRADPGLSFLYPIPASPAANLPQWQLRSPVLHFRAETATFLVSRRDTTYNSRQNVTSILNACGKWCGVAILHNRLHEDDSKSEIKVEFVKVADGEIFAGCVEEEVFPEARFVRSWGAPEWYRYANVIMVNSREEGLVERIAVGRIREYEWISATKFVKDIQLA
ncbi:hypothetical protein SLS56_011416 [Neofusicoccum ribis]|uniref:Heterokaryon incompatibility domain-containing protein n=1 Tax=Neofusicoccum ribis TaxID=45134 RepID=A0ABR3SCM9_9PEZI